MPYIRLRALTHFVSLIAVLLLLVNCSNQGNKHIIRHSFTITKTDEKCTVDGEVKEDFWKNAEPLGNFRIDADPERIPEAETSVYLSYSDKVLTVAFLCEEPRISELLTGSPEIAKNDYCELQVFSRPETPYYSPYLQRLDYKNANNAVRTQRHFIVTAANEHRDGNIYKVGAHTPYITDDSWEDEWEGSAVSNNSGYVVEMAIPWVSIGGMPEPGHTFKLHFVRRRSVAAQEFASFNWCKSENLYIVSLNPVDFTQEHPQIFAPMVFKGDQAVLNRYIETKPPWKVKRDKTFYESILTNETLPHRAAHFYLGIRGFLLPDTIRNMYDEDTWATEEMNFITELGRNGINGPFLPGFMSRVGSSGIDSLYNKSGMKFSYHSYGNDKKARAAGATMIRPRGTVAFFDPRYVDVKTDMMKTWLQKHGRKPWLFDIRGQDEPFNQITTILQPGTHEIVERELKEQYGVRLGVPVGVPNVTYQDQPVHENSRYVPDHEKALSRIAMFRWINKQFYEVAKQEYDLVRRYAPDKLYQAYNRNAVADMDFLDQSLIYDVTDYFSADPYTSFCIYVYGTARSRYHVGFTSKFVTDLAAGKPTQMIIQGCDMIQRYSTPENVLEWTSQAAKAGVTMLDWWGNPRLDHPDLYREMLRLSKLWTDLPALDIPVTSEIAVLFSDDSRAAAGDEGLHAHYTLHVILGEKLGAWFNFVSENHIRKGLQSLNGKKLVIAPQLGYLSRSFASMLLDHVQEGATLVILDPDAFKHDIDSGSLDDKRRELLGLGVCQKRNAERMIPAEGEKQRFSQVVDLPLRPIRIIGKQLNARTLKIPPKADILFTYSNGEPAAFSRKVGAGEVIVFGAMPFEDSELALQANGWDDFFKAVIDELEIERDLPIWNFMFPKTGGEVETMDLLVPELNK